GRIGLFPSNPLNGRSIRRVPARPGLCLLGPLGVGRYSPMRDQGQPPQLHRAAAAFPTPCRSGVSPRREWGRPEYGERIMAGLVIDIALMSAFITEIVIAAVSFLD